jgi:hypothetical protein
MKLRVLLAGLSTLVAACAVSPDNSQQPDDLDEFDLSDDPAVMPDPGDDPDLAPDVEAIGEQFEGVARSNVAIPDATAMTKFSEATANQEALATTKARTSRAIRITGVKQHDPVWCVPASGHTILSAFMANPPTQTTLAHRMHTDAGTLMQNVPPILNDYEHRNNYILAKVKKVENLLYIVHYNVRFKNAPMMAALEGGDLPDWAAHGFVGYHAIVLYGWIKEGSSNWIKTWDPLHVRWSGAHAFRAKIIQQAMNDKESFLVW